MRLKLNFNLLFAIVLCCGFSIAESHAQLSWVKYNGSIPANAVIGGQENGKDIVVCRCNHNGGTHPGKVVARKCHIGWGGKEVYTSDYEILTNKGYKLDWKFVTDGKVPAGAVVGGAENGKKMYVGRAYRSADKSTHPGKVFKADIGLLCNYSWGGKEIVEKGSFYVLVNKGKNTPPPPATQAGKIGFFNEGGYVARYSIFYTLNGYPKIHATGNMALKEPMQEFDIPAGATNIQVFGEAMTPNPFDPWTSIFSRTYSSPPTTCFKTYGTIFDPQVNSNCEAWVPVFSGTVHVTNQTGEKLHVGWCTDLGWSLTNVTNGFILGAIAENMQNFNPNAVRFFAFALAADIDLSKETFNYFKKVSYPVQNYKSEPIVSTGVAETFEGLFNAVTSPLETVFGVVATNFDGLVNALSDEEEKDPRFMTSNLEFNPIIQAANIFGAETLNLVVFNESMTKYWLIPTSTDSSWIIRNNEAVQAKKGTLNQPASYGSRYPVASVKK
jgi:hypothetical protein